MSISSKGLSVVIVARNAEETIVQCLQSVVSLAEEVIVVTNDCTDATESIARSYGANVIEHAWEGFRDQKNFAIGLATCEWILSLDADEVLSPRLSTSIRTFIISQSQTCDGAKCARCTSIMGKWIFFGDWYPDFVLRLFKNGHGHFVGGSVHERLEIDGKVGRLKGDLLHYSCESLLKFTRRNVAYADMAAVDMFNNGKKISALLIVAKAQWKFFRCFVLKGGFFDGFTGYYLAKTQSFLTLYKYFRLRRLTRERRSY
ncbi:MAG: glycosyltransferase family 2 protein [Puniceicoccales bacterium]|jgi:glycosyltransferase involved in cell wall biosynthesis|nr:glycosyltransferase family 2 protein [Puniceicoccales bacterium]